MDSRGISPDGLGGKLRRREERRRKVTSEKFSADSISPRNVIHTYRHHIIDNLLYLYPE